MAQDIILRGTLKTMHCVTSSFILKKKTYHWLYTETPFQIHLLFLLAAIFMNDYILMLRRWDIYSFIPHLTNHLVAFNPYQGMGTS